MRFAHHCGVFVDDAVLPAAAHLTGRHSGRVLSAALDAVGGTLEASRPCHLHYRPGHHIVVRFDSRVRWAEQAPVAETLVAATTVHGPPPGTLPVEATTDDGATLEVGVWRWPFDPVLTGLGDAVTPSTAAAFLNGASRGRLRLDVVAYRPTQRAVVRAVDVDDTVFYLKAVRPKDVTDLVDRHQRLLEAGVPVPEVLNHDADRGLIAMAALPGLTIRERIRRGQCCLPGPEQYEQLYGRLAGVGLPSVGRPMNRAGGALRHASMLASVLPSERGRLDRLTDHLAPAADRADDRAGPTIHGDLYEAQLVTGHGRWGAATIAGVLDLDDAGAGDPLDDRATVIAHLMERVVDGENLSNRGVTAYVRRLRSGFAERVDPVELDLVTAGALVGLATSPFRIQRPRWPQAVRRRLRVAERLASNPGQRTLRIGR